MGEDQVPLWGMKYYRKALRDVVDWLEQHSDRMNSFRLTTGKDYMAFLRMFRDDPEMLMEYGGHAQYPTPEGCREKVRKVIAKWKEERENGK